MEEIKGYKSGFIAVVGRTNVGKSTLLNCILGQKLSIISNKPQTTRNNIRCIRTTENSQMVFIDTPGFHKPKSKLGELMVDAADSMIQDADVVLFLVEEDMSIGRGDQMLLEKMSNAQVPVILVINKVDKIPREEVLEKIKMYQEYAFIDQIIPVSALKGENVQELITVIESYLPEGPQFFPEDMVTDRQERFIVAEIIREKILNCLQQEIPHGTAVEIMNMKLRDNQELYDIEATIYCEKKSHKSIIIGKNGVMLKKIGIQARQDIEQLLETRVNLKLWVKLRDDWRDKAFDLKDLGYKEDY